MCCITNLVGQNPITSHPMSSVTTQRRALPPLTSPTLLLAQEHCNPLHDLQSSSLQLLYLNQLHYVALRVRRQDTIKWFAQIWVVMDFLLTVLTIPPSILTRVLSLMQNKWNKFIKNGGVVILNHCLSFDEVI